MGNSLCNTKKKPKENNQKPIRVIVTNHSKKSVVGQNIDNLIKNQQKNKFNEIGDDYLSFLPEEQNNVSFVLYGEDLSKVRQTFLNDLNNMKDFTLKLSKNEMLLITEENRDLQKLFKSKNIDPNNLFPNNISQTQMSMQQPVIVKQNHLKNNELPDFVKAKYNKMVERSFMNSKQLSGKYLDTSFMLEDDFEKEVEIFLKEQCYLRNDRLMPLWSVDYHELVYVSPKDQEFHVKEQDQIWQIIDQMAIQSKLKIDQNHRSLNNKVIYDENLSIEDIEIFSFTNDKILSVILAMINYDKKHQTNQIKRMIYPHENGLPKRTPNDVYIFKLYSNGARRAIFLQEKRQSNFTIHQELYPMIIENALLTYYGNMNKFKVQDIMFRLSNWIPETIYVKDIGNASASFSKLKENFDNGHLLIFFIDQQTGKIKPILGLEEWDGKNKKVIKTVGENGQKFTFLDWKQLYENSKIQNLYINWNPTIYSQRKKLHFQVPVKFQVLKNPFYNTNFQANRYGQVLLTIYPHQDQAETRIVVEKHTNINTTLYKIKYYLYHFYNNRLSIVERSLKEMSISESEYEILSDLIIFEKNKQYENYILMFEMIPEDTNKYHKMPLNHTEVLTVSIFSFAEFNIVEIPYKKIDCYSEQNVIFSIPKQSQIEKLKFLVFPLFKFTCNHFGYYEIRVDGNQNYCYGIYIYKFTNFKNSINQRIVHKGSTEKLYGACSLSFKLEEGNYIIQIIPSNRPEEMENENDIQFFLKNIENHEINVLFISYSEQLVKNFEEHLPDKNLNSKKFTVEQMFSEQSLKIKKVLKGQWNEQNNFGTIRAQADCYQKFMKNPGFIIQVEEETELKFSLKAQKGNINKEPVLGICVIEIMNDFKFKFLIDGQYQPGYQYDTEDMLIKSNLYGYLVLCFNLSEQWQGQFDLTISSDKKLKSIRDNQKCILKLSNESKPITGVMQKNSGGHLNNSEFLFNPVYQLIIDGQQNEQVIFLCEIVFKSQQIPCSMYLYNTPKQSLFEFDQIEIQNGDYNPAFLYEINSLYKVISPGHYLLVPSTLAPLDTQIPYELRVYCSHRFKIQQSNPIDFSTEFIQNIPDCIQYRLRFLLKQQTKAFIILQSQIPETEVTLTLKNSNLDFTIFEKKMFLRENYLHQLFVLNNINSFCSKNIYHCIRSI